MGKLVFFWDDLTILTISLMTRKGSPTHILDIFENLQKDKIPTALTLAQNFSKDKETALNFLEKLIITTDENPLTIKNSGKILKKIQDSFTLIKSTNVNIRFALENLFLNLYEF